MRDVKEEIGRLADKLQESNPGAEALQLATRRQEFLIRFSKIRRERRDAPDSTLKWLTEALPSICQNPETACARVTLDGRSIASLNFRETSENHRAAIVDGETVRGELQAGHLGGRHFPKEDCAFLDEIAVEIGLYLRRVEAEAELLKRDRILDAITKIAAQLMRDPSFNAALPDALRQAGEALAVDRVVVLERSPDVQGGLLVNERVAWNAPGAEPQMQPGTMDAEPEAAAILGGAFATLAPGDIFTMLPHQTVSPIAEFLRTMNVRSLLVVPIAVEGKPWGYLGFDDCHAERKWTTAETDALRLLGDLIGASIARGRSLTELADAKRIVENSATVLFRLAAEPSMPLIYISENIAKWGYAAAQFRATPHYYMALVHPDDVARVMEWMKSLLADAGGPNWLTFRIRFANGNYRWFENHISAVRDPAGSPIAFDGMLFDITERKQAEERFNFISTLFQTAMEKSPSGFLVVGTDRRILTSNRKFLDMWKIPSGDAKAKLDKTVSQAVGKMLKDPQKFLAGLDRLHQHPEQEVHDEIEFLDGRVFERQSAALHDQHQQYLGRMFLFHDITERKQAEHELARLARTDPLTGLANRSTFLERVSLALAAARREDNSFAVLYVDIDNFKDVNDTLGHPTGDIVLKTAAQRMLATVVRETDLVARFGGDEFCVLQTDVADPATAGTLAATLRAVLAAPFTAGSNVLRVTASVGISLYAPEVADAAEILAQADRALYRAKEEGRDRYRFHSQELDAIVHERVTMAGELRAGIERNELELYYQPQVAVATREVVGMEALVRWNHPRLGQLKPGAFLPAAELTGVIVPLGAWVLDRACGQFRQWRDQGVEPRMIAVNLSVSQLKLGLGFCHFVQAILEKWGLAPRDLEFDVPEAVLSEAYGTNSNVLKKLRDLGVRLAIDDFGAEYTSMGRVKAYRVERLKIAPNFIKSMTSDAADAASVRLMIQLAARLGLEIVAKNVETQEQQAFLAATAGDANAQGFYYSRPLPAALATEFLRRETVPSHFAPADTKEPEIIPSKG